MHDPKPNNKFLLLRCFFLYRAKVSDGRLQRRGLVPSSVAGEVGSAAAVGRFSQNLCSWAGFLLSSTVFLSEQS